MWSTVPATGSRRATCLDLSFATTTLNGAGQHTSGRPRHRNDGSLTSLSEFDSLTASGWTANAIVLPAGATAQASANRSRSDLEPMVRRARGSIRASLTPSFGSRPETNPSIGPTVSFCGPRRSSCRVGLACGTGASTSAPAARAPASAAGLRLHRCAACLSAAGHRCRGGATSTLLVHRRRRKSPSASRSVSTASRGAVDGLRLPSTPRSLRAPPRRRARSPAGSSADGGDDRCRAEGRQLARYGVAYTSSIAPLGRDR
jgi:hypothetical protein